jgi:hypothetical protein
MSESLNQRVDAIADYQARTQLWYLLSYLYDRLSSALHTAAGLVINGAGAAFPKTGAAITYGSVAGVPIQIPAGTALPSPVGANTAAGQYIMIAYWASLVNGTLTYTYTFGAPGASAAAATYPQPPAVKGYTLIGYLLVTYASAFTGGTTPLDTATTVFISPVGAVDPTATFTN